MKEIKRVFGYHGAEHKSIACYEAGEELTVENVRKHTRFHPRCGTSFYFNCACNRHSGVFSGNLEQSGMSCTEACVVACCNGCGI